MIQIIILVCILLSVLMTIFGINILYIATGICIVYLLNTKFNLLNTNLLNTNFLKTNSVSSVQNKLILSDKDLKRLIDSLSYIKQHDVYTYDYIIDRIYQFLDVYLVCFSHKESYNQQIDKLKDIRRDILNTYTQLDVSGIDVNQTIITNMNNCLWKYIQIIINKYKLKGYGYPIPYEVNNYDLF